MAKRPVERSRSGDNSDTQLFSLRLPVQLWAELGVVAKLRGKSMNELLSGVLSDWWSGQSDHATVARLVKAAGTVEAARERSGEEKS